MNICLPVNKKGVVMKRLTVILTVAILMFSLCINSVIAQEIDYCQGNFDCDADVDGTDASVFKTDFGRSPFSNPCPSCPPPAPVEKTGQTTSWATGDDGDLEEGVAWSNPRFTDNGDETITDNLTGLIWMKDADCFGQRSWMLALSDCNGLASGSCGVTDGSSAGDWRLPNKKELISLTHDGYYNPSLSNTAGTGKWSQGDPFTNVQFFYYWSSTTAVYNPDLAWGVLMSIAYVDSNNKNNYDFHAWCVQGGQ